MDVSKKGGTQQPWVFLLKMIILGCFAGTPIFGNTHLTQYEMKAEQKVHKMMGLLSEDLTRKELESHQLAEMVTSFVAGCAVVTIGLLGGDEWGEIEMALVQNLGSTKKGQVPSLLFDILAGRPKQILMILSPIC